MERVEYVIECHNTWPCSQCNASGWHKSIWINALWVSGANPVGPPTMVICNACWEAAEIGPLVK